MTPDELDQVFKALADPTRRRIIDRLRADPGQSLFQICAVTVADGERPLSRQAVTQHLDMLEKAGLVRVTWSGRTKLHDVELLPLRQAVGAWLNQHLEDKENP